MKTEFVTPLWHTFAKSVSTEKNKCSFRFVLVNVVVAVLMKHLEESNKRDAAEAGAAEQNGQWPIVLLTGQLHFGT